MAEKLGKIEKLEAGSVSGKRKLLLVPLIYYGESAPDEYLKMFTKFWDQVASQISNLETKIGSINHVYHESIAMAGEEGLAIIEKLNPACHKIVKQKCDGGAALEITEDKDMVEESMDWERCLMAGFISQKVGKTVSEFYMEVATKRYEKIAQVVDETLKADEVGAIFMREGHRVQFPKDVEVFSVSPPALDEIHRWQRDYITKAQQDEIKAKEKEAEEKKPE
ncbi:MAG: hypothetical protein HN929_01280 [Chloroflexi bacterium]|jgi:hypothetical protein|nr:hypothetical protein [Chloroflexota bacterium]MBT7080094.1 hypothetical protein [Chloroflexota bacterium]MBT7290484.1 hypothetical protein [Chloroflexota bacterium]